MTVDVMTQQSERPVTPQTQREPRDLEPSIQSIIERARRSVPRAGGRGAWCLSVLSAGLLWASFPPLNFSPLAWVALVPVLVLTRIPQRTRWMYTGLYAGGAVFFVTSLQWMRLGDPTMYPAWLALALYLSIYFPLFVGLTRVAVYRMRVPLIVAGPVVWVGFEYARAYMLTGFSWYYLGHTQYRWTDLIQVSDLGGAYGVSLVMMISACAAARAIPVRWFAGWGLLATGTQAPAADPLRPRWIGLLAALVILFAAIGYGRFRRSQADFEPGPRIALIQGNFTASAKHDGNSGQQIFNRHHDLTFAAAWAPGRPDIIVWPETMFPNPLFIAGDLSPEELTRTAPEIPVDYWDNAASQDLLEELSERTGAALIIGIDAAAADRDRLKHFNSAVFVTPDAGLTDRYDKNHRVPFGEYIPFREQFPFLHRFTPYGPDFGLDRGEGPVVFGYEQWRFSPLICFEDTVPHLVRRFVREAQLRQPDEPIDCLVNLTNDGWFHGSSELDQHLITASFRAVECRTPMVRAVNTGISAFIDGNGVIVEPDIFIDGDGQGRTGTRDPRTGRWHRQMNAALLHTVPLDSRRSLYVRWGDWLAGTCGGFTGLIAGLGFIGVFRGRSKADSLPAVT